MLLLIIGLNLDINSGCCCKNNEPNESKNTLHITSKNSKNINIPDTRHIALKKQKNINIHGDHITFNGKNFEEVSDVIKEGIVNEATYKSYIFDINDADTVEILFDKTINLTPQFNSSIGYKPENPYILAVVETNYNCYIVYYENANSKDNKGFFYCIKNLNRIRIIKSGKITRCNDMFNDCDARYIDIDNLDTSEVEAMNGMFFACTELESIDLSNLNISKVTNIRFMFGKCLKLKTINFNNPTVHKFDNIEGIFRDCKSLILVDLTGFKTNKAIMDNIFTGCTSLKKIKIDIDGNKDFFNIIENYFNCTYSIENNIITIGRYKIS